MRKLAPGAFGLSIIVTSTLMAQGPAAPCNTAGLNLPPGFCATVFAEGVIGARHLTVAPNGDVLVNTRGRAMASESSPAVPGGVFLLRDADGNGRAEVQSRLTTTTAGTGIALAGGYLYQTAGTSILRYAYRPGAAHPLGPPDTVVTGLPSTGHSANNFVVSGSHLYVNVGSRTNSCQEADRQKQSRGIDPCTELESRAGIWRFDANRLRQQVTDGHRYATGLRNSVAFARNPANGRLYTAVHGRDQLYDNWQPLFTTEESAEKPAEVFVQVGEGDNFGWPYCYYDPQLRKYVTAPEYGGDGKKSDRCAGTREPLYGFPGHWAPNGLAFYTGTMFPRRYRNGAFIAFHGSWNRAPLPQAGFNVVFQPMSADGKMRGPYEVFADGFMPDASRAQSRVTGGGRRPTGLAVAPDGALYLSDDLGGTIWRIAYRRASKDR